ncbi:MAG: hypothetical protein SFT81_06870 [Candidatus Caenarcaniphilales bacterium]|nr:hypothetical protein [Candidatus Caenarcaniphilales bacterium]
MVSSRVIDPVSVQWANKILRNVYETRLNKLRGGSNSILKNYQRAIWNQLPNELNNSKELTSQTALGYKTYQHSLEIGDSKFSSLWLTNQNSSAVSQQRRFKLFTLTGRLDNFDKLSKDFPQWTARTIERLKEVYNPTEGLFDSVRFKEVIDQESANLLLLLGSKDKRPKRISFTDVIAQAYPTAQFKGLLDQSLHFVNASYELSSDELKPIKLGLTSQRLTQEFLLAKGCFLASKLTIGEDFPSIKGTSRLSDFQGTGIQVQEQSIVPEDDMVDFLSNSGDVMLIGHQNPITPTEINLCVDTDTKEIQTAIQLYQMNDIANAIKCFDDGLLASFRDVFSLSQQLGF